MGENPECRMRDDGWQQEKQASEHLEVSGTYEHRLILLQPKLLIALVRHFDVDLLAARGGKLNLNQGACRVDVLDPHWKRVRLMSVAFDLH